MECVWYYYKLFWRFNQSSNDPTSELNFSMNPTVNYRAKIFRICKKKLPHYVRIQKITQIILYFSAKKNWKFKNINLHRGFTHLPIADSINLTPLVSQQIFT